MVSFYYKTNHDTYYEERMLLYLDVIKKERTKERLPESIGQPFYVSM